MPWTDLRVHPISEEDLSARYDAANIEQARYRAFGETGGNLGEAIAGYTAGYSPGTENFAELFARKVMREHPNIDPNKTWMTPTGSAGVYQVETEIPGEFGEAGTRQAIGNVDVGNIEIFETPPEQQPAQRFKDWTGTETGTSWNEKYGPAVMALFGAALTGGATGLLSMTGEGTVAGGLGTEVVGGAGADVLAEGAAGSITEAGISGGAGFLPEAGGGLWSGVEGLMPTTELGKMMAAKGVAELGMSLFRSSAAKEAAEQQASASLQAAGMMADAANSAAKLQIDALEKAVASQEKTAEEAIAELRRQYDISTDLLKPYAATGEDLLGEYARRAKAGPGEFKESPGYQFTLGEGLGAIERSAAARGKQLSGQTMKGLVDYAEGRASTEYDSFLNRYYASLGPFQYGAELGEKAAGTVAGAAQNVGGNVANIMTGTTGNITAQQLGTAENVGNLQMSAAGAGASAVQAAQQARTSGYLFPREEIPNTVAGLGDEYMKMKLYQKMGVL